MDDKDYSVVGINGYRRGGMTLSEAIDLARRMQDEMRSAGWRGTVRVFYRDGSEVDLSKVSP